MIWFEDALVFYGSNTCVFDLHLLVADARQASNVLARAGFQETDLKTMYPGSVASCRGGIRLESPDGGPDGGTVLMNAADWKYDLRQIERCSLVPLPPFNKFLDSIMGHWLGMSEEEVDEKSFWAMYLVNLINYGYNLEGANREAVRKTDFARQLQPEFLELHYDLIGNYPHQSGLSCYRKHEYHALRREQIKSGKFIPSPYPADRFPPSLAEYPRLNGLHNGAPQF